MKNTFLRSTSAICATLGLLAFSHFTQALSFNFVSDGSANATVLAAFTKAGARWSAVLADNVTINLAVGYRALSPGVLGSTSTTIGTLSYSNLVAALNADAKSIDDQVAVSNLDSNLRLMTNRTWENPYGIGSATPYLDTDQSANNTSIVITSANARALGLLSGSASLTDGAIVFSNNFNFDFDPTDGINTGNFDFIGIAAHEIGHALGFISNVDLLDFYSLLYPYSADAYRLTSLDLFRYSSRSAVLDAVDFTADTRYKYFSIDGGMTAIAGFSTGTYQGNGQQASHWLDDLGLGIMDPTAGYGEVLSISSLDTRALDVIGWNLNASTVALPDIFALIAIGSLGLIYSRIRSSRRT